MRCPLRAPKVLRYGREGWSFPPSPFPAPRWEGGLDGPPMAHGRHHDLVAFMRAQQMPLSIELTTARAAEEVPHHPSRLPPPAPRPPLCRPHTPREHTPARGGRGAGRRARGVGGGS